MEEPQKHRSEEDNAQQVNKRLEAMHYDSRYRLR